LTDSGSVFVQIGDENVHRVRALMDEAIGAASFIGCIVFAKTSGSTGDFLIFSAPHLTIYCGMRSAEMS
jgi:adenine-specific DNA-methyltransferase